MAHAPGAGGGSAQPPLPLPTNAVDGAYAMQRMVPLRMKMEGVLQKVAMTLGGLQRQARWPDVLGHLSASAAQLEDVLEAIDNPQTVPSLLVFPAKLCANPAVCTCVRLAP
jgi:hypothetical protein